MLILPKGQDLILVKVLYVGLKGMVNQIFENK